MNPHAQTLDVLEAGEAIVTALNIAENNLSVLCKEPEYIKQDWLRKRLRKDLRKITKAREIAEHIYL